MKQVVSSGEGIYEYVNSEDEMAYMTGMNQIQKRENTLRINN